MAGCEGEVIDEFEDEEAGEGAAEVGDASRRGFVSCLRRCWGKKGEEMK